jgi:hypothetical protein
MGPRGALCEAVDRGRPPRHRWCSGQWAQRVRQRGRRAGRGGRAGRTRGCGGRRRRRGRSARCARGSVRGGSSGAGAGTRGWCGAGWGGREDDQQRPAELAAGDEAEGEERAGRQHGDDAEARGGLAEEDGQGADALGAVGLELVGVLAEQHGGRAEGVGEGDPGDAGVVVAAADDVVGAADHQRAPHEQDGGLAEADVLERPGVEEDEEDAGGEEGERDGTCLEDQVDAGTRGRRRRRRRRSGGPGRMVRRPCSSGCGPYWARK